MKTTPPKKRRVWWPVVIVFSLALVLLIPMCANATHLWSPSALHFDEPAFETATFNMSEEEFTSLRTGAELRMSAAYDALFATLAAEQQTSLEQSQAAWQAYYDAYAAGLSILLDSQVLVFYDVEGEERKTNIYKDTLLALLEYRAQDLEAWSAGRYAYMTTNVQDANTELRTQKNALVVSFQDNAYYNFRASMQDAHNSWFAFQKANNAFIASVLPKDLGVQIMEELVQVRRMLDLSALHLEGSIFYHRDREE